MTRKDFEKEYNLSRRQTDRLFDKAREDGYFELPGAGRFGIRKGKRKTDPIEVYTMAQTVQAAASSRDERENMPKAELDRLLVLANIRKTEMQIDAEREKIRQEAFAEVEEIMVRRLAALRNLFEELPPEWRDKGRAVLNECS